MGSAGKTHCASRGRRDFGPMASGSIKTTDKGPITIVELDLNEKNVINSTFVEEMTRVMDAYESSKTIRAMIVTANGKFFSNGFDPESVHGVTADVVKKNVGAAFRLLPRFYRLPFITILAINGHCMGYGAVWALFFDFRFMVDKGARFGYPEALIGLALPVSTSLLLKDLVGTRIARDLATFGAAQKPEGALELGLVDAVYGPEELLAQSEKFAQKFNAMSRTGLIANKMSLKRSISHEVLSAAVEEDVAGSAEMILSPDGQEGMASIIEGRRPNFGG